MTTPMTFLLVTPADAIAIDAINAAHRADGRQLMPTATADDRLILPLDLRSDCGPDGTWAIYGDLLRGLTTVALTTADFPQPALGGLP